MKTIKVILGTVTIIGAFVLGGMVFTPSETANAKSAASDNEYYVAYSAKNNPDELTEAVNKKIKEGYMVVPTGYAVSGGYLTQTMVKHTDELSYGNRDAKSLATF